MPPAPPPSSTLSLHVALPISVIPDSGVFPAARPASASALPRERPGPLTLILRTEEHTSEVQPPDHLGCRLLLQKKKIRQSGRGPLTRIMLSHEHTSREQTLYR